MKFRCNIKNGKLLSDSKMIQEYVSRQRDGAHILEIRRIKKQPTQTMRYYYKIMAILADGLGLYPDEIKDMVKAKLNHYEHIKDPEGRETVRFWSTADYTPEMFNEAIQLVQHWGAINGIYIMDSEEYKLQLEN